MRLLVTRAEPGATATAARIAAAGAQALVSPLLAIEPLVWTPPPGDFDAIVLTSANAARHAFHDAGPGPAGLAGLPCLAVGAATAAAARAAGFANVTSADGDAGALFAAAAAAGLARLLHLAGEDRTTVTLPPGLTVVAVPVYRAVLVPLSDAAAAALAAGGVDRVLLASVRTARHFAAECDRLALGRSRLAIVTISAAVAAAAGAGWRDVAVAAAPNEMALLAAAGLSCDKAG